MSADVARWDEPAGLNPRGTVVVLPGRGERPGVYRRFGARLAADAYRVRVLADPTDDPETVAAQVKTTLTAAEGPRPRVLAGSDTGALFALHLVAGGAVLADALVLAGLPGDLDSTPEFASVTEEIEARASCPSHRGLLADGAVFTPGALTADRIPATLREAVDLASVDVPVLGLHGVDDPISPLAEVLGRYAALPDARVVSIADGRHDVLNAINHRSVAATVVTFLERLRAGEPIVREVAP